MANFHTNVVAIVAQQHDMLNVLRTMGHNLCPRAVATGFAVPVDAFDDVDELFCAMRRDIEDWYWLTFLPYDGLADDEEAQLESDARPLSESGSAELWRRGSLYALLMEYATAWTDNGDDVSDFMRLLPDGLYAFAHFDADEYDNYDCVWLSAARTTGDSARQVATCIDSASKDELCEQFIRLIRTWEPFEEEDLADVAYNVALCGWMWYGSIGSAGYIPDETGVQAEAEALFGQTSLDKYFERVEEPPAEPEELPPLPTPEEEVLYQIRGCLAMMNTYPLYLAVDKDHLADGGRPLEGLVAGMGAVLRVGARYCGYGKLSVEALAEDGTILGEVTSEFYPMFGWWGIREFTRAQASLGPLLSATIEGVMPKSHWIGKTSAAGPNLVLRVELGPAKLADVTEGLSDYFWKARPGAADDAGGTARAAFREDAASSGVANRSSADGGARSGVDADGDTPRGGAAPGSQRSRNRLIRRSLRSATLGELIALWRLAGLPAVVDVESNEAYLLPPGVGRIDTEKKKERRATMLSHVGRPWYEQVGQTGKTVCEESYFHGRDATIVAVSEQGGLVLVQGERRPWVKLRRETLLYGLWAAGVVTDADLAPSDEWRSRYGIAMESKTHAVTLPKLHVYDSESCYVESEADYELWRCPN